MTVATIAGWSGQQDYGLIYCHGSGGTAALDFADPERRFFINTMAQLSPTVVGDWAFQSWGNDAATNLIDAAVNTVVTNLSLASGKVVLVAGSMGGCVALNYARRFPSKVLALALALPLVDLGRIYDDNPGGAVRADVDAAYGGSFDASDRATHSPIAFVDDLDPELPIHLFTASNDPLVLPVTATAFVAARPQTERTDVGALGHTDAALVAAAPLVSAWVKAL